MQRKITLFVIISVCFLLQTTVFQTFAFAGISPNLMIIVVSSVGFMRGRKEGMITGLFCGLLIDIFFGFYLGLYALLYMNIGYLNGMFRKRFYPDDIRLPMVLIGASDMICNLLIYFFTFLFRGRLAFGYYLKAIILPELVYTMVITIFLYFILLKINAALEAYERRSAKKFDL